MTIEQAEIDYLLQNRAYHLTQLGSITSGMIMMRLDNVEAKAAELRVVMDREFRALDGELRRNYTRTREKLVKGLAADVAQVEEMLENARAQLQWCDDATDKLRAAGADNSEPERLRAYKHVPACFADAFESGASIQVGLLSFYRKQGGDRGDPYEGLVVARPETAAREFCGGSDLDRARLRSIGIPIRSGTSINLTSSNNRIESVLADRYIFSASREPDWSRKGEVVFEIIDVERFAARLTEARSDILETYQVSAVNYAPREGNPLEGDLLFVNPMIKDIAMEFETEVRIAWAPATIKNSTELVTSPEAAELVKRVTRP